MQIHFKVKNEMLYMKKYEKILKIFNNEFFKYPNNQ